MKTNERRHYEHFFNAKECLKLSYDYYKIFTNE